MFIVGGAIINKRRKNLKSVRQSFNSRFSPPTFNRQIKK